MNWEKISPEGIEGFRYPLLLATKDKSIHFFADEYELKRELMLQGMGLVPPKTYTHWTHITLPL